MLQLNFRKNEPLFNSLVWGFYLSLVAFPVEFTERSHSIAGVGTSE